MTEKPKPEDRSPDDDDLFGIDLGPRFARKKEAEAEEAPPPPREKPPTRTLTEHLAAAKVDRDSDEPPAEEDPTARE